MTAATSTSMVATGTKNAGATIQRARVKAWIKRQRAATTPGCLYSNALDDLEAFLRTSPRRNADKPGGLGRK